MTTHRYSSSSFDISHLFLDDPSDEPHSPEPEHMGMRKVKLPGRRRLCKFSNNSPSPCPPDDADDYNVQDFGSWETDEPAGDCRDEYDDDDEECHDTYLAAGDEEAVIGSSSAPYRLRLPASIMNKLYAHQREGVSWLWSLHCSGTGGVLGDDMGLGKTMQVAAFLAGLFHSDLIRRVLVVAPKTILTHWSDELSAVGLGRMIRKYIGNKGVRDIQLRTAVKEGGILLTTYGIVRNDYSKIKGDFYNDAGEVEEGEFWNYVILDEAHNIKNRKTETAKSLRQIPCVHRIAITGTPLQNNLEELKTIFNFCCPEVLGDKKEFKEKYERPIVRGNEKSASDRVKQAGSIVAQEFRAEIIPYFLRRMKSTVSLENGLADDMKLKKKNQLIIWLKLTDCQRQRYKAFLNSERVHLAASQGNPLAAITVLKKICNHPQIVNKRAAGNILEGMDTMSNDEEMEMAEKMDTNLSDMSPDDDVQVGSEVSCKLSFILALLRNLRKERHHVVIFSQTCQMLDLIQEAIVSEGYDVLRMDGTTKTSERDSIVKDFQEGLGAPIFLLTTRVGGVGITLTKAARVIVVDPNWNPCTDDQSVDRLDRIGQTKDVIVYRLMTCGTVEEKIYKKQVLKGALFRTATENDDPIRYFSQSEIKDLFSLPEQGFDVCLTQKQLQQEHGHQLDVDEEHIEFLHQQGIAGVSNHSRLFSKTEALPMLSENDALGRVADANNRTNTNPEITEEINRLTKTFSCATLESRLPECGDEKHATDNE